ncbi:hypothetical protein [Bradyrhizobium iriomotense]|uniref:Uncharacterized protein n=1 Tax=Bradyrhizobium iriomotense TaxID=441950 RepID=A0ABQ6B5W8_9BRAD|nr:hypothetical protein [Bradyrhizobium iriomotense]GLR89804.1 hypothetical protein GCM10007857_65180 [Bradyrhizobium iriomotense]
MVGNIERNQHAEAAPIDSAMMIARKPLKVPPQIARSFLADMRAYFQATSELTRDEIAAHQLHVLSSYFRRGDKEMRLE